MKTRIVASVSTVVVIAGAIVAARSTGMSFAFARPATTLESPNRAAASPWDGVVARSSQQMMDSGRATFRFATFGDEAFWTDGLGLDKAIAGGKLGGVGAGVSPKTALALGLKVDMDALPASVVDGIKAGKVDLNDPATTLTLIKLNAVLGVVGTFTETG